MRLMRSFPQGAISQADIDEFNAQTEYETLHIRDFIILHYHLTNRTDTPFWRHVRSMDIPDTLRHRMDLFRETGRVFRANDELFAENSWTQVMLGQGLMPESHHPVADVMSEAEVKRFLDYIIENVNKTAEGLPSHEDYLKKYCPAKEMASSSGTVRESA
jgi:tryptophan halogenase